ncbi:hypothetical protein [Streptomyces roseicoloratus]|nr:hypothetical protein [Streptomyces roseicoloratus]
MLALVFHSVTPDAERAQVLTARAAHLLAQLHAAVRPADTTGSSHERGKQR